MARFNYGNTTIDYTLYLNPLSEDITISVEWLEGVSVEAPESISNDKLNKILNKKAPWIIKKWSQLNEIIDIPTPKEFVSGEKFPYLGRHYRLRVIKESNNKDVSLSFYQGRFIAKAPIELDNNERHSYMYQAFKQWYISNGQHKVEERLKLYSPKMEFYPLKVILKEQKMRWGTCTKEGAIYLNWKIVMAPMNVLDYILVHELAHLKYYNHSKEFWQLVHSILPDYKQSKEWLRINGPKLTL